MAGYRLSIKTSAAKELEAADNRADRQRLVERIQTLAETPTDTGYDRETTGSFILWMMHSAKSRSTRSDIAGMFTIEPSEPATPPIFSRVVAQNVLALEDASFDDLDVTT